MATSRKKAPAAPVSKPAAPAKAKPAPQAKPPKRKLVRDSFTIPADEYELIGALKQRALALGRAAKKSELLRAGLKALHQMADTALHAALKAVPAVKTGRPKARKAEGTPAAKPAKPAKPTKVDKAPKAPKRAKATKA